MLLMQLFLLLSGCAQLPEYARPHIMEIDNKQEGLKKGITYRQLTIDDFQALELPANIEPHAKSIGAHTCCQIRVAKDSKFTITRGYLNQQLHYFGSIKYIVFEAVMDPECSWLNPDISGKKLEYVLEHEQIHFALMEIAARKLTREARKEAKNFIAIQSTYEDTQEEILAKIRGMVLTASQAVLKEHTSFDEDTSLYFDPKGQRWWLDWVEDQFFKTRPKINFNSPVQLLLLSSLVRQHMPKVISSVLMKN
jgi:hypothetical protein